MGVRQAVTDHFAAAVQWSEPSARDRRAIWVAALAIAAPILVGAVVGRLDVGFTIGLGAMLLAGESPTTPSVGAERTSPGSAVYPALLAVVLASLIAALPSADVCMIALAGAAAVVSGYSRPVAVGAIRFIIYLVLSVTLLESAGAHRGGAALIFGLGALWNVAVKVMLSSKVLVPIPAVRQPSSAQRRAYFKRSLRSLSGWQFTLRLVVGLGLASVLRHLFPAHHFTWIVLTAALLTQRQLEHVPVKITQRSAGTILGVLSTWLILLVRPTGWTLALAICGLGTAAPLARARNYLLYATLSTPVILLVMDIGKTVDAALLVDRLTATLIGAVIVIALNVMMDRLISLQPKPSASRPAHR